MNSLLYSFRLALQAPSRNSRTAVALGRLLGSAFIICFLTGLLSHFIQDPLPGMHFLTRPIWLYQVTQGLHVTAGILCLPLILGKLYAIYPLLFQTPPIRGAAHFLERASIALFVAASLVQIAMGLLNTFQWYQLLAFPFRQTHFSLSFVIIGSLAIHIAVKLPIIARHWRRSREPDVDASVTVQPEPTSDAARIPLPAMGRGVTSRLFAWIDRAPQPPAPRSREARTSRRGFFATIAVASAAVVGLTVGQSARAFDFANIFAPRKVGIGPNALPVNRTAAAAKVIDDAMSPDWKLTVTAGSVTKTFSRPDLEALRQYEVSLPIACVEGWSQLASWKGPRLKDLMDLVGAHPASYVRATSLEKGSSYAMTTMEPEFARDELTLIALHVDGARLDIDHGYPARLIAPARPGVLQTKWLTSIEAI